MMPILLNLLLSRTPQHINNMDHAEAFFATCQAGKEFLRLNCPIFYRFGIAAVITISTIPFKPFTKVAQLNSTATVCPFGVVYYLTQLLMGNTLFFWIGFLIDEIVDGADISST